MFKIWLATMAALWNALWALPGAFLSDVPKALCRIWRALCRCLCALWRHLMDCLRKRCASQPPGSRHTPSPTPVPINHPALKKPDPLIYDQYYLMALGFAVTWQNPDIEILLNGVPVASAYDLAPNTTYEVVARIWNGSTEGVVSGLVVAFSYLSFGVQTESNFIGTAVVDLGVKGSAHCPAYAKMLWTTPATPGHYCLQVSFFWLDDLNPWNNLGQDNTQVVQAASPAVFTFALGNTTDARRVCRFEYDTYALPPQPQCADAPSSRTRPAMRGNVTVPTAVAARHKRADFPLPAGWTIDFNPPYAVIAPGDELDVQVTITPPDPFHGKLPLNIHAFAGNVLVGGVTLLVNRA